MSIAICFAAAKTIALHSRKSEIGGVPDGFRLRAELSFRNFEFRRSWRSIKDNRRQMGGSVGATVHGARRWWLAGTPDEKPVTLKCEAPLAGSTIKSVEIFSVFASHARP